MFTDLSGKQKSLQRLQESNPGSMALETDALTTRPTRQVNRRYRNMQYYNL